MLESTHRCRIKHGLSLKRVTNALAGRIQIGIDECGMDSEDAKTARREGLVTQAVGLQAREVNAAVDFNDEVHGRCEEIDDKGAKNDLAPKADAELMSA